MKFVPSIIQNKASNILHLNLDEFKEQAVRSSATLCEQFVSGDIVKPYIDVDVEVPISNIVSTGEQLRDELDCVVLDAALTTLSTCFLTHGLPLSRDQIAIHSRHGPHPKPSKMGVYKVTYHCIVNGYKIRQGDLRDFLKQGGVRDGDAGIDLAPYNNNSILNAVHCHKGRMKDNGETYTDTRRFLPDTMVDDIGAHLAQFLTGDETLIEVVEGVVPKHVDIGASGKEQGVIDVLREYGDMTSEFRKEDGHGGYYFETRGSRTCPNGHAHTSNNFWIRVSLDGEVTYHCLATQCVKTKSKIGQLTGVSITLQEVMQGDQPYSMVKRVFEKTHFKVMSPTVFGRETRDGIHMLTRKELCDAYENVLYEKPSEEESTTGQFVHAYLKDPHMRTYERIDFLPPPLQPNTQVYNSWTGFQVSPLHCPTGHEGVTAILNHMRLIAGNNDACFDYLLKFTAHMFQKPGILPRTCIVIKSSQGTGKNTFTNFLKKLVPSSMTFETADPARDIFGRFTEAFHQKLLVVLNEANGMVNKKFDHILKAFVSDDTCVYEAKGRPQVTLRNCARLIMFTNKDFAVPIEVSDRRYVVFEASDDKANNFEYFATLNQWMDDVETQRMFFDYLQRVDVEGYDFVNNRPLTETYKEMRDFPIIAQWLVHLWHQMMYKGEHEKRFKDPLGAFTEWCMQNRFRDTCLYNSRSFGHKLKGLNVTGMRSKKSMGVMIKFFEREGLQAWLLETRYISETEVRDVVEEINTPGFKFVDPWGNDDRIGDYSDY
jgi:hypothetical protein